MPSSHPFSLLKIFPAKIFSWQGFWQGTILFLTYFVHFSFGQMLLNQHSHFKLSCRVIPNEDGRPLIIVNQEENEDLADWGYRSKLYKLVNIKQ